MIRKCRYKDIQTFEFKQLKYENYFAVVDFIKSKGYDTITIDIDKINNQNIVEIEVINFDNDLKKSIVFKLYFKEFLVYNYYIKKFEIYSEKLFHETFEEVDEYL